MYKKHLLSSVALLKLPLGGYCLFGGACLAVRNLRLVDDVDLFVTKKVYDRLRDEGWREVIGTNQTPYLSATINKVCFEAHKEFMNRKWQPNIQRYLSHPEIVDGVPFMPLDELYEWKSITRRSKDVKDIKLIESFWSKQKAKTKKNNKKVLIIGGGGREHALAWKLSQSPHVDKIFVAPGNGGTAQVAENVDIGFTDVGTLLGFAKKNSIDLTIIGQEAASDAGVVDAFQAEGLIVFGPTKAATLIESSKAFSKNLMEKQRIPTARYEVFDDARQALNHLKNIRFPVVIKADGLAEGKGVVICQDETNARSAIKSIMQDMTLKEAGSKVVIEDFLSGQEVSIHALCSDSDVALFPPSQDYKQIFDGDNGPNTGGIGVIAPVPWVTEEQMAEVKKKIVQPALAGLRQATTPFQGCLYPGLMVSNGEMNVIEFNARFGDPEAEVYMRLLESDLFELLDSCARGQLETSKLQWKPGFALCVSLCSKGYPGNYKKNLPITGLNEAEKMDDIVIFHSGTKKDANSYKTNGGRVVHVTATGQSIVETRAKVYAAIKKIHFEGMHYRTDIGLRQAPRE